VFKVEQGVNLIKDALTSNSVLPRMYAMDYIKRNAENELLRLMVESNNKKPQDYAQSKLSEFIQLMVLRQQGIDMDPRINSLDDLDLDKHLARVLQDIGTPIALASIPPELVQPDTNLPNISDQITASSLVQKIIEISKEFEVYSFPNEMIVWVQFMAAKAHHIPTDEQVMIVITGPSGVFKQATGPYNTIKTQYLVPLSKGQSPLDTGVTNVPHGESRVSNKGEVLATDLSHGHHKHE